MSAHLKLTNYLERQSRRLSFYRHLQLVCEGVVLGVAIHQVTLALASVLVAFSWSFSLGLALNDFAHWAGFVAGIVYVTWFWPRVRTSISDAAHEVENQSPFFKKHADFKSELFSAAAFERLEYGSVEFKREHQRSWAKRLHEFSIELRPSWALTAWFGIAAAAFFSGQVASERSLFVIPERTHAWTLTSFEEQMPDQKDWVERKGALSGVQFSHVRFRAPDLRPWQAFVFVRTSETNELVICGQWCEFELRERGTYAVGTLWSRSAYFPLVVIEDESPKSAILVRDGKDMVPTSALNIRNAKSFDVQILASDDIELKLLEVIHSFDDKQDTLAQFEVREKRFNRTMSVSTEGWKGGAHQILVKARDYRQESVATLSVMFADEEFMRAQRIQSLRQLIDEWIHVLGDLLESEEDQKISTGLSKRLEDIRYPDDLENDLMKVYVEELRRLAKSMQRELVDQGRIPQLPHFVRQTEKQILYGLSLILQERAGELRGATDGIRENQNDLNQLIEEMKKSGKFDTEALNEAFRKLQEQLKALQDKIKSLPQGPSDQMINREALDQQVEESRALEEKIAEIQKKLADGHSEEALRELQSLVNQLSILSKEIDRSMDQWQQNLDQGAMQASQDFQKELERIRKDQEKMAEATEQVERDRQEKRRKPMSGDEREKMEAEASKKLDELSSEQEKLMEQFQKATEKFDQQMAGTEWEPMFRSEEAKQLEQDVEGKMRSSQGALQQSRPLQSAANQREAVELLKQAEQKQNQQREQVQKMSEQAAGRTQSKEKVEILQSEGKGKKERRRKILESLKQKVDDNYQKSHERYFEDLLQR